MHQNKIAISLRYLLEIILPLSLEQSYTYECILNDFDSIDIGSRVIVQFGRSKYYTGIVLLKHNNVPELHKVKMIEYVLDEKPIVNSIQIKLWQWISKYYLSNLGEVYRNVMPASLKLESETKLVKNPDFKDENANHLSDDEYLVYEALNFKNALTIKEISDITSKKRPLPTIKKLVESGVIIPFEDLKYKYKPKRVDYVSLAPNMDVKGNLKNAFLTLDKTKKQKEILMKFLSLKAQTQKPILLQNLLKSINASRATFKELVSKGILTLNSSEISRLNDYKNKLESAKILNHYQEKSYQEIKESFANKNVVLFQGVTSSGKTEVYIKLIQEQIEADKQVLLLVPEIALTTQLTNRLEKIFGTKIGVYHSKFNPNERVEIWNTVNENTGKYQIILGPRSALFLPFSNLGLIIVDEEHDSSFKQQNPSPRYNARDMAIVLAHLHNAKTLLGSATPSLESVYNVLHEKYGHVKLTKRYGDILMPNIEIADIKKDHKEKKMHHHFGEKLFLSIEDTLRDKKQIILFQNRRGYSPIVECDICGTTTECTNCDVSLTYHHLSKQLRCHYCGYSIPMIKKCSSCGSHRLNTKGFGTEQIEKEVEQLFPDAIVARLDLDTTKKKYAYQDIIYKFESKEIDILIGTQMISKGLDFDNVALVGILNADNMLHFPDFRAHERAYQLMTQVAGRSGRKKEQGKVIIQTFDPFHKIIQQVSANNFNEMVKEQLQERKNYYYPPFYRLIKITVKHKNKDTVDSASQHVVENLLSLNNAIILGPEYPSIARVRNLYNKNILIKVKSTKDVNISKVYLKKLFNRYQEIKVFRAIKFIIDVDPTSH